jgi:acyl-CoA hydrolase
MSRFLDDYRAKLLSQQELVSRLKPGDFVILGTWIGQPPGLLRALGKYGRHADPLFVSLAPTVEAGEPLLEPHIRCLSSFLGGHERAAAKREEAKVIYTPLQYTDAHRWVRANQPPTVLATRVAPMDERGYFNLSLTSSWQDNALRWFSRNAPEVKIVVEVNRNMPPVRGLPQFGNHEVHVKDVTWIVEDDSPLAQYGTAEATETDRAIANNVAALVEDRATIQLGIGTIPMVIGRLLTQRKELGVHSEMFCQAHVDLIEAGSVTNGHKGLYDGVSVATFALGEDRLYKWVKDNPAFAMLPVEEVNAIPVLSRIRKMTSINSLLNVDLCGQACAHCLGTQTYSGMGGAFEFCYGAQLSPGGKGIHCLKSTTTLRDGCMISNIVAQHAAGTRISIPEHSMDWVVTEFGAVRLKFLDLEWRAASLIRVAHPQFRDELTRQAVANGLNVHLLAKHRQPPEHFFSNVN